MNFFISSTVISSVGFLFNLLLSSSFQINIWTFTTSLLVFALIISLLVFASTDARLVSGVQEINNTTKLKTINLILRINVTSPIL